MPSVSAPIPAGPPFRYWNTLRLMRDPQGFYGGCRDRWGDTFRLKAANGDVVCTCDPAAVRDILKAEHEQIKPFAVDALGPLLGEHSVLTLAGVRHRAARKRLTPPFHGARMRAYGDTILEASRWRTDRWSDGQEVVLMDEMLAISIAVIVRAVFGVLEEERVEHWSGAVKALVGSLSPIVLFAPSLKGMPGIRGAFRRFEQARAELDALLFAEMTERRTSGRRGEDILSMMLDTTLEDGSPLSDAEIRDDLVTLLFAGHETTQIGMSWMIWYLCRDPAALAALRTELDPSDGSPETLGRLPLLEATWNETLRLVHIVPDILRTLTADLPFGDRTLPAGTHVAVLSSMVHLRPDLYPDPETFRPRRFLERKYKPHEFLPFGGGVRRCLGASLANWEAAVVVGTLVREWDFESLSDEQQVRRNLTMGPKNGVRVRVRRRAVATA